jgi:hypothetical protein
MNDSHGQVFSLKKVVRHADFDLLILFLSKDRIKQQFFPNVGDQHKYCCLVMKNKAID